MKLDIIFHYEVDPNTGLVEYKGKEEITVDTAVKAKKATAPTIDNDKPKIKLNASNFTLNQLACDLLKVEVGSKVHINYPKKDGKYVPAIGSSESMGVKSGNVITKSLTVSYRGAANTKLAEFGETFELIESTNPGIFYLKGDKMISAVKEAAIEIDDSFELDDLEDLDLEEESTDISTIDLTL